MSAAGMYHYLVEDIPHAVISLVAIKGGESMQCQSEVDLFAGLPVQVKPEDVAWYLPAPTIINRISSRIQIEIGRPVSPFFSALQDAPS